MVGSLAHVARCLLAVGMPVLAKAQLGCKIGVTLLLHGGWVCLSAPEDQARPTLDILIPILHPGLALATNVTGRGPPSAGCVREESTISLRLLALILCSNCSNTFNKVLTPTWRHTVKLLFATSGHHFSLLKMFHGWSKHFTSRYDPSTPTPNHCSQAGCNLGVW